MVPAPLFYFSYIHLESTWVHQAKLMASDISSSYSIPPDQMQICNPLFCVVFIPILAFVVFPGMFLLHFFLLITGFYFIGCCNKNYSVLYTSNANTNIILFSYLFFSFEEGEINYHQTAKNGLGINSDGVCLCHIGDSYETNRS